MNKSLNDRLDCLEWALMTDLEKEITVLMRELDALEPGAAARALAEREHELAALLAEHHRQ
jgi:hypothetical protein